MTWVLPFSEASGIQNELDGSLFEISQSLVLSKMQKCVWGGGGKVDRRDSIHSFFMPLSQMSGHMGRKDEKMILSL